VKGKKQYEEGENSADYNAGLPVVAFTLSDDFKKDYPHVKQDAVSNLLRAKQYIVPSINIASTVFSVTDVCRLPFASK
jgi:glutamate decarboxylase